ncbi:MAG TPA: hypothetical protein DIU37_06585 [Opitutae bacterium]|nr:hypothetical protein [Opitutae bacterium]
MSFECSQHKQATNYLLLIPILSVCILSTSCATQPHRARQLSESFQKLPSEAQARVLKGEIALGDSPEAVYFALGTPSSIEVINTTEHPHPVWSYHGKLETVELPNGEMAERFQPTTDMVFIPPWGGSKACSLNVEFQNDRVSKIYLSKETTKRSETPLPLQAFLPQNLH